MISSPTVEQHVIQKEEIPINKSNPTSQNSQGAWDSVLNDNDKLCASEVPAPKKKPSRKMRRSRLLAIPISITVIALMALACLLPLLSEAAAVIPHGAVSYTHLTLPTKA